MRTQWRHDHGRGQPSTHIEVDREVETHCRIGNEAMVELSKGGWMSFQGGRMSSMGGRMGGPG